jgi:integrase
MTIWEMTLTNRSASDDRVRLNKHVLPRFRAMYPDEISVQALMTWIDEQRSRVDDETGERLLSDATIRHNLNLVSRFYSWAIARGHAQTNPVRAIPHGERPRQTAKAELPWIDDDAIVRKLIRALLEPYNLMFYIGNRSGLRLGEIIGLRMSDLDFADDEGRPILRVRYSFNGPLKEDKRSGPTTKTKWAPTPDDWADVIEPWRARRLAEGAQPEDYVFPYSGRRKGLKQPQQIKHPRDALAQALEDAWNEAVKAVGVAFTFYQATRHSFCSRSLKAGATLDEVSEAVGHSSPVITKRYYSHYVRKTYSNRVRSGLGLNLRPEGGELVPLSLGAPVVQDVDSDETAEKKKAGNPMDSQPFECGVDGTRTRGLRRDRRQ